MRWVSLALLLLTVWAVIDAIKRKAEPHWYFLLVLGFPVGAFVYFAWVKLRAQPGALLADPHLRLLDHADQLEQRGAYHEAERMFAQGLELDPADPRALHGAARCLVELDRLPKALEHFDRLMQVDPRYRDYQAALEYAETLSRANRAADAADLLRGLVAEAPRTNHKLALAHYLTVNNQTGAAREVLTSLLAEAPASAGERWVQQAKQMLAGLPDSGQTELH